MHYVQTYFFNANPGEQSEKDIKDLENKHDSLATVVVGKVFMHQANGDNGSTNSTWYWWPVKEKDKTYLLAYLPTIPNGGVAPHSYYVFTFRDGTQFKWMEPRESPYNHNAMFLLVSGKMKAYDSESDSVFDVEAPDEMQKKLHSVPLYYVTKYNGYAATKEEADISYEPVLQYVFTDNEGQQLLSTLQCMDNSHFDFSDTRVAMADKKTDRTDK